MTGPHRADGSLRANRFGSVADMLAVNPSAPRTAEGAYWVLLPDLPGGGPTAACAAM